MNKSQDALPDLLSHNLDLVICGTAVGHRSAATGWYYAGTDNQFWTILNDTGLTSYKLSPKEYENLGEFGIGLTDLAKRVSGVDTDIKSKDYDIEGFKMKLLECQPYIIGFNGKKAAKLCLDKDWVSYGRQDVRLGESILFVLPSTSSRAWQYWDPKYWHQVAKLIETKRER